MQQAQDNLPSGIITYLFTDIEGSSRMWEAEPDAARQALHQHDTLIIDQVEANSGIVVKSRGEGDSHFAVFANPADALQTAVSIQRALAAADWPTSKPLRVRMALHTGPAELRGGDYYGRSVNRTARIRAVGHGGQLLLSEATAKRVRDTLPPGVALRDLGLQRLKDLSEPERIFQADIDGLPQEFPPLNSLNLVTHNLPAQSTTFVGRTKEVAEVLALLTEQQARLVTLTGPGGTGKTRLALQIGQRMIGRYPDGVFFVPLSEATGPDLVISKTARALGVREAGNQPTLRTLKTFLQDKQLLLLLDNFEQVLHAAPIAADLLQEAPRLQLLVTSQALLNLRAEYNYPVPTLALPSANGSLDLSGLRQNEGTALFLERAQAANPRLEISQEQAALVADICRRLDGLPLAIELAAARLRFLTLQALADRLSERFNLLTGGARDLPERQRTLRNAIDWSYGLLGDEEQTLLARLSVFAGGFTLEAAEAVCASDGDLDVFGGLERLLDHSLLTQTALPDGRPRFGMLEAIRDYAAERLAERGETEALRDRHLAYFGQNMAGMLLNYGSPDSVAALDWTDREHDNIRAALARSLETTEGAAIGADLTMPLTWYWYRRGFVAEGRAWSERVLAALREDELSIARVRALASCALMAMWQGDLSAALVYGRQEQDEASRLEEPLDIAMAAMDVGVIYVNMGRDEQARANLEQAVAVFAEHGIDYFRGVSEVHLANASVGLGDFEGARAHLERAAEIAQEINEPWLTAFLLNNRGELARVQGRYDEAKGDYVRSEQLLRQSNDAGDLARLVHTLAYIDLHEGHLDDARQRFRDSLAMFRMLGNQRGIAECLAGLAGVLARQGLSAAAAQLLTGAAAIQEAGGAAWWPADRVDIERSAAIMAEALDETELQTARELGRAMTMEQAVEFALDLS